MREYMRKPWFWPVVGFVLLLILTRGQLLVALAPMSKFLLPVGGGYLLYRLVKWKVRKVLMSSFNRTVAEFVRAQQQAAEQMSGGYPGRGAGAATGRTSPVIEICPTCGEPKKAACPDCQTVP